MKLTDQKIFKYLSYDIAKKVVCEQKLKFNNPSFFNDPFDCDIDLVGFEFKNLSKEVLDDLKILKLQFEKEISEELILEAYKSSQQEKLKNASICCFSMNYQNLLMWSHYGDNHSGVILIFDPKIDDCFEDLNKNRISFLPVDYSTKSRTNYLENKEQAIIDLFTSKSEDWKYEEEFRLFTLQNQDFFKFKKKFLTGAIFGCRVSNSERDSFIEYCNQHGYTSLKYGYFEKKSLKIELKEIETYH